MRLKMIVRTSVSRRRGSHADEEPRASVSGFYDCRKKFRIQTRVWPVRQDIALLHE